MSSIGRANKPTWSSVRDSSRMPERGTRPWVGLNPYTPQNAAGRMVEPLVWLPSASGTMPAATAAAEPLAEPPGVGGTRPAATAAAELLDEPPGVCLGFCGLLVLPGAK